VIVFSAIASLAGCGASDNGQPGVDLQSIQIAPANPDVAAGQGVQLTATARYSDGTTGDVTREVSWVSSNSAVATASSDGQVHAMSAGLAVIHATLSGVSSATQLTVTGTGSGVPPGYAYIASAPVAGHPVPGTVYEYSIGSDGSLTPLGGAGVLTGVSPSAIVSDPTGRYVYVANGADATISQFAVGSGGELTTLSPAVVSVSGSVIGSGATYSVSAHPSGRFVYVVTENPGTAASIAQYSIGDGGTLAPLSPAYVSVTASGSGAITIDPSGQHAYLAGANGSAGVVTQFAIGADGTLLPLTPAAVGASQTTIGVAIVPAGHTAYVLSACADSACDGEVGQYLIGSDGTLASTGMITVTGGHVNPVAMVTDGSGSSAYLLTNFMGVDTNSGAVYQYTITATGMLVAGTPNSLAVSSGSVAVATYGSNVYALSADAVAFVPSGPDGAGHVDHYTIGPDGLLTAVSSTTITSARPTAMTLVVAH
jgi:6-phosphogluconolactonase (cycloisomerase 2 family)